MRSRACSHFVAGAVPAHGRALTEDHVAGEHDPFRGHVNDRVPDLVARPDVDQVNLHAVEIQHESFVEQRRRQRQLDPVEVVVLPQLPADGQCARAECLEHQTREEAIDAIEQLLDFPRVGNLRHAVRHRSMRDDLGAREELVAPHMVTVLVGIDHALRHALPDACRTTRSFDARGTGPTACR